MVSPIRRRTAMTVLSCAAFAALILALNGPYATGDADRGVEGCFSWATVPGFFYTNLNYRNQCKSSHHLRIVWSSSGEVDEEIFVRGHTSGSVWSALSAGISFVEDEGTSP
ncbi:hypothetical protein [Streptomyces sp. NPDC037389]|uniref:hypothetical protein n=1 Tax=Streptomyces sp. NPDC037389 TaxID=3155369 RepID=UPI0033DA62B5